MLTSPVFVQAAEEAGAYKEKIGKNGNKIPEKIYHKITGRDSVEACQQKNKPKVNILHEKFFLIRFPPFKEESLFQEIKAVFKNEKPGGVKQIKRDEIVIIAGE